MGKISYSQFSKWVQCPYTWKIEYVDKIRTFQGNIHTLFGTSMHEVLQTYLTVMYNDTIKMADALPLRDMLLTRMKRNYKQIMERNGGEVFCEQTVFKRITKNQSKAKTERKTKRKTEQDEMARELDAQEEGDLEKGELEPSGARRLVAVLLLDRRLAQLRDRQAVHEVVHRLLPKLEAHEVLFPIDPELFCFLQVIKDFTIE